MEKPKRQKSITGCFHRSCSWRFAASEHFHNLWTSHSLSRPNWWIYYAVLVWHVNWHRPWEESLCLGAGEVLTGTSPGPDLTRPRSQRAQRLNGGPQIKRWRPRRALRTNQWNHPNNQTVPWCLGERKTVTEREGKKDDPEKKKEGIRKITCRRVFQKLSLPNEYYVLAGRHEDRVPKPLCRHKFLPVVESTTWVLPSDSFCLRLFVVLLFFTKKWWHNRFLEREKESQRDNWRAKDGKERTEYIHR